MGIDSFKSVTTQQSTRTGQTVQGGTVVPPVLPHIATLRGQIASIDAKIAAVPQPKTGGWSSDNKASRDQKAPLIALRADLQRELGRMETAMALPVGQLPGTMGPQTREFVGKLIEGLPRGEAAVVIAKSMELGEDKYSLDDTNKSRFSANLAVELSEYVAAGNRPSTQLAGKLTTLLTEGSETFRAKPELKAAYDKNMKP